jgi:molybdate transport system regulatory protein
MPADSHVPVTIKIRIPHEGIFAFGPGKAALLEAIDQCHSVSAAGRSLGLSYTKTRRLLDELKGSFRSPVIESIKGGAHGGGSRVTDEGHRILAAFRAMEHSAQQAVQEELRTILAELGPAAGV